MKRWCISKVCAAALLVVIAVAGKALAAETNAPILQIESGGHTAICRWVGFTPDGRQLVSAGYDKVVRVWDLSGVAEAVQQFQRGITNAPEPPIPLVRSLRMQIGPGHEGKIYAGAISPKPLPGGGWLLAVGGYGTPNNTEHWGDIRLLDLASGQVLGLLRGHSNVVLSLAFSPDGRWLASGSVANTVRVWDLGGQPGEWPRAADGALQVPGQVLEGHEARVTGLAFVPGTDGASALASASYDKTLRLWRREGAGRWGRPKVLTPGHTAEVVRVVASPDGLHLASASFDRSVRLWDARDGKFLRVLGEIGGAGGMNAQVAFTPDGQAVVAATDNRWGGCHVWRVSDGRDLARFSGHDNTVQSVAVARLGGAGPGSAKTDAAARTLVASTGGNNQDIFLWDAATGRQFGHIAGVGRGTYAVAFSPDSRWVAWGNRNEGNAMSANKPLDLAFDLSEMKPSAEPVAGREWRRAVLAQAGWSVERPDSALHTLVLRRGNREVAKVERSHSYDRINCYSFLPDGKVVVGSHYGLTLHEAATGKELREFIGHTGQIYAVAVSPDGRLLVSGSNDQAFRLWNLATGELLLSVFVGRAPDGGLGEWVAWTPAGYYKSSAGGDKLIGWHLNRGPDQAAEFVAAWQMRKLFERPEIVELVLNPMALSVTAALELHNKRPGQRREERLDISEDFERLRPPTVMIDEPTDYQTVKTERVKLRAKVIPSGQQPVTEVRVLVNGCPAPSFPGLTPAAGTGTAQRRDIEGEVELEAGSNLIEVLAGTASASSAPKRVTVVRETRSPDAQPTKPDCYFLGIGVTEYQDKSLDLKFAAADARGLAAAFQRQQGKLFGKVDTNLVLNSQAVPRRMKAGLSWLQKSATPRDLAVVLVSAHGSTDAQGGFYIAPYDFDVSDPGASGMSKGEFLERLGLLPCKVLCLLDACHSGRMLKGPLFAANTKGLHDAIDRVVAEFNRSPGSLVTWASSTGEELSVEDPAWGHGAFTAALIEALTGELLAPALAEKVTADKDSDGVLHLHELSGYVVDRVKELTGGNQHPLTGLGSTPSFPIAIVGRPTLLAVDLSKQRPRGMRSEAIKLSLADLKPEEQKDAVIRLAKPARYEDSLKQFYGGKGKVALNSTEALEFEVSRLRGVVTGDTDTWEQLTLNFFVETLDQEVKITCTAWGQHLKAVGSQPPKPAAFRDQLYADYKEELKRHVIELMNHMKSGLKF